MYKDFKTGFTLIEVMIIFTVMAVILAASIPLISGKSVPVPFRFQQGAYYCIADNSIGDNKFIEAYYTKRRLVSEKYVTACKFNPPRRASVYRIELIGAGAGGNGFINVTNPVEHVNVVYDINDEYVFSQATRIEDSKKLFYELTDRDIWNMFKGVRLTESSFAQGANRGGNIYYKHLNACCSCSKKGASTPKFGCRYDNQSPANKVCYKGKTPTDKAEDWNFGPSVEEKKGAITTKNKSTKFLTSYCENNYPGGTYECLPDGKPYGIRVLHGGIRGDAGYIRGRFWIPDVSYSNFTGKSFGVKDLLRSYVRRMTPGHCKNGSQCQNNGEFVDEQLSGNTGSMLSDTDDDVGFYNYNHMAESESKHRFYDPDTYFSWCKEGSDFNTHGGSLCYAKKGDEPTDYAAVRVPAYSRTDASGVPIADFALDGFGYVVQKYLAKSGGPAGIWISNDKLTVKEMYYRDDQYGMSTHANFDGDAWYSFEYYTNTNDPQAVKYTVLDGAGAFNNKPLTQLAPLDSVIPNWATPGEPAAMEKVDGKQVSLPENPITIIPQLNIDIGLTYRRYELGLPGDPGEKKVFTVSSLEGPCDITVHTGDRPHNNGAANDNGALTPAQLASVMSCNNGEQRFEALGGKFRGTKKDENHFNIHEYRSYTDVNGSNYGKEFSYKAAEDTRIGGLISDFNTVFYKHIKELINGKKEKKAENLITNLGKGGDGPTFEDKCVKRFRGTYDVTVDAGDESSMYTNKRIHQVLTPNCLPNEDVVENTETNRYFGTNNTKYYKFTNATRGYGGAVIVTW